MLDFAVKDINSWEEFHKCILEQNPRVYEHGWIYRGQTKKKWPLETTLARSLFDWNIELKDAAAIEFQTIREFRRRLRDPQYNRVHTDTLSCLALMQHHGAPTRLLDCSYSPFAAAAFAIEKGPMDTPVVWCFRGEWLKEEARKKTLHKYLFDQRNDDRERTDHTFLPLYQLGADAKSETVQFVKAENPLHFSERMTAQQGVFLCPADLGVSFAENLKAMSDWHKESNVVKLHLNLLDMPKAIEFAGNLKSMNLSFATLFPGLDGFARSISQQMFHYSELQKNRAGLPRSANNLEVPTGPRSGS